MWQSIYLQVQAPKTPQCHIRMWQMGEVANRNLGSVHFRGLTLKNGLRHEVNVKSLQPKDLPHRRSHISNARTTLNVQVYSIYVFSVPAPEESLSGGAICLC